MTIPLADGVKDSFVFLVSGQYSDFTIRCQGHEWKVHRAILCGQSGFFRKMCENGFKETTECAVDLVDDEPEVIAQMLIHIYNPKYYVVADADEVEADDFDKDVYAENKRRLQILLGCSEQEIHRTTGSLSLHAKVHGLSRKYDIPSLSKRTCQLFPGYVRKFEQNNRKLKDHHQMSNEVIDAAKVIYGSTQLTDRAFKHAIIYVAQRTAKLLAWHHEHEDAQSFRAAIASMDDFAWDLVSLDFERAAFKCNECGRTSVIDRGSYCRCARRGICGRCRPVDQMKCEECGFKGGCELL